jgi:hypothetical protein
MESNNVILFPSTYKHPPRNLDEVINSVDTMKQVHIQETISTIVPIIFQSLAASGFDFGIDEETDDVPELKDGALLVEAMRSMLCKQYKIYHPFQDIAENAFFLEKDGLLVVKNNIQLSEIND